MNAPQVWFNYNINVKLDTKHYIFLYCILSNYLDKGMGAAKNVSLIRRLVYLRTLKELFGKEKGHLYIYYVNDEL